MNDDAGRGAESSAAARSPSSAKSGGNRLSTGRLEAFSDGVFAIAITLLVLELHVPEAKEGLLGELAKEWSAYLGYFISFAFIGGVWVSHSNAMRFIKAVDGALMRLNLLLLLFVSLLPFTTALMATHLHDSGQRVGVVLFGLNLTLASFMVNAVIAYAAHEEELAHDDVAEEELLAFEKDRRAALLLMAVATGVGLLLPRVAAFTFLAVSVFSLVEPLWRAQQHRRHARKAT